MELESLWKKVQEELRIDLSIGVYKVYIEPTRLLSLENNIATIGCNYSTVVDKNKKDYYQHFKTALDRHTRAQNTLIFEVKSPSSGPALDSTPLFSYQKNSSPTLSALRSGLHPKYTFDHLVVGNSNNFAYAAAQGIVKNPGLSYNPFYIWGGVGVGKTHLMQAIGHELLKNNPDLKVRYFPAETFGNELISSLKSKNISSFKDKYRSLDCILVDDIQFIAGKDYTQEEFFHTFNALHMTGKQVVLTSDRRPDEIKGLEDRLISRFMGGLTVDIQTPDYEMRSAIIQQKAAEKGTIIDSDATAYLADKLLSNTRDIEGKVQEIAAKALSLHLTTVDLNFVETMFSQSSQNGTQISVDKSNPRHLISVCAHHFNLKTSELCGSSRQKDLVTARHITAYLLLTQSKLPLEDVGRLLGGRDHTSIMHARDKVTADFNTNPQTRSLINRIIDSL